MNKIFKYWKISAGMLLALIVSAVFLNDFKNPPTASLIGARESVYAHSLVIILDDAHGENVAGKGSPDGRHREWQWSKFWVTELGRHLNDIGFTVEYTAPEDKEPGLLNRVVRMNKIKGPAFVLSLHNNAAGMGDKWKDARGYSMWTTKGVTRSDECATIIFRNMSSVLYDIPFRQDLTDGDPDYESNFTVLMSKHPSVLIEFMFQDNETDLELLENKALCNTLLEIIDISLIQIERYLIKNQKP